MEPLIALDDVSIGYENRAIVSGIDWSIEPASLWGVIGPNGAGKTTLLRVLLGLDLPLQGRVRRRAGLRFGYVKQRDRISVAYPFTVGEVVAMGREGATAPAAAGREAVCDALRRTGISALRDRPLQDLSGGQKQRALIARALAARSDVIVLDEPTNDMDIAGEESVLDLIRDIHRETGAAVIVVSHLLHAVLRVANDMLFLKDGRFGLFDKASFVQENHLERFYDMPIRITEHPGGRYSVAAEGKERDRP